MKVTLEFNLPEELEEYESYFKGPAAHSALADIADHIRKLEKYHDMESISLTDLREQFYLILDSKGIGL